MKAILDAYRTSIGWQGSDDDLAQQLSVQARRYAVFGDNCADCIFVGKPLLFDAYQAGNGARFAELLGVALPVTIGPKSDLDTLAELVMRLEDRIIGLQSDVAALREFVHG